MARQYQLTAADVQAVANTSARLGIKPADLMAVMHYETIGTMNPTIKGGKGGNYQGLIQFGPRERRTYGYNADASFAEQVEGPVYRYLKDRGLQPGDDVGRLYRTINGGNRNAKLWKNDGNGTIAQHIERIKSQSLPRAQAILQAIPPANVDAIMDVASRNDAPSSVANAPTASQGVVPDLSAMAFASPPPPPAQAAITDMLAAAPPPMPTIPPTWASASGFPIDEALTGANAQDVLMGGPRMDPRRIGPASAPIAPDMGSMQSPADVLAAGPRLRPGGAPDASQVPDPLSRLASGVTPPPPLSPAMPNPPMRPEGRWMEGAGGAPDAGSVPNPPPRGTPYTPTFPDLYGEQPQPYSPMVAGREEFPGALPAAPPQPAQPAKGRESWQDFPGLGLGVMPEEGDLVASTFERDWGRPSQAPQAETMDQAFGAADSRFLAREMMRNRQMMEGLTAPPASRTPPIGNLGPDSFPQAMPPPAEARTKDDVFTQPPLPSPDFNFTATPSPLGPQAGAMTGEGAPSAPNWQSPPGVSGMTYAPPMPPPPPDPMASRFDDAFSPGGGGQIMDLQSAFDRQNAPAPPPMPPAPPSPPPPIGPTPAYADLPPISGAAGADALNPFGPSPATAATVASQLPQPMAPPSISMGDFNERFTGSVVQPASAQVTVPAPADVTQQSGVPDLGMLPDPSPRPRNLGSERERNKLIQRLIGGAIAGPIGALGAGIFGGKGAGGGFGFGQPASFAWTPGASGSAPYGNNGGSTNWKSGTSNALGGSNALTWTGSNGQPVTVVENPWSPGTYFTA